MALRGYASSGLNDASACPSVASIFAPGTGSAPGLRADAPRRAFVAELPALPLAVYEEPLPVSKAWPDAPCGYVRTSATYDPFLAAARKKGWPVRTLDGVTSTC